MIPTPYIDLFDDSAEGRQTYQTSNFHNETQNCFKSRGKTFYLVDQTRKVTQKTLPKLNSQSIMKLYEKQLL